MYLSTDQCPVCPPAAAQFIPAPIHENLQFVVETLASTKTALEAITGEVGLGDQIYDGLAKYLLILVVHDNRLEEAIQTIKTTALSGNPGDGKIFVTAVEKAYTIRTGKAEL